MVEDRTSFDRLGEVLAEAQAQCRGCGALLVGIRSEQGQGSSVPQEEVAVLAGRYGGRFVECCLRSDRNNIEAAVLYMASHVLSRPDRQPAIPLNQTTGTGPVSTASPPAQAPTPALSDPAARPQLGGCVIT